MRLRTMREIYKELNIPRTTLQGWITEILGEPTQNSDIGWCFDEEAYEKIWQIRFYKQLGYTNKKIKDVFASSSYDKKKSLDEQIIKLKRQKEELERLIQVAEVLQTTGIDPATMRFNNRELESISYSDIYMLLSGVNNMGELWEDGNFYIEERVIDEVLDCIDEFAKLRRKKKEVESYEVVNLVGKLYQLYENYIIDSLVMFRETSLLLSPNGDISMELDKIWGVGCAEYISKALSYYCESREEKKTDIMVSISEGLERIIVLGKKKYSSTSDEVQTEVKKIFGFINEIKVYTDAGRKTAGLRLVKFLDAQGLIEKYYGKGAIKYIGKAMEFCCKNESEELF